MGRLDNYEEVKDRLPRFWQSTKGGRIVTEIIDHSENWDRVVYKASLFEGDTLIATGHAMDWKGKDNQANRTNWVEVCETSAIGRAIANSRYQDPNVPRASREEMEVAQGRVKELDKTTAEHPLIKLINDHKLTDKVVTQFFGKRGWVSQGQSWKEAGSEKLDQVYGRAKQNPKGFVEAIAA